MRALMTRITIASSGQTSSAISVRYASSFAITISIPTSIASAEMVGKNPFIVSVWIANVSAASRYMRSPALRTLWKRSERRCRCW